jgi:hypothetical protein
MTNDKKPTRHTRKIPSVGDTAFDAFNEIRIRHHLTWNEVFERFLTYQNGIEYIFSAPPEMTKERRLDLNTVMGLIDLWIGNIRENWSTIHSSPTIQEISGTYKDLPALVIGAGPTVRDRGHLLTLKEYEFPGPILVTAHALKGCLEAGIVPTHSHIVDANEEKILRFIDDPLVDDYADRIKMILCVSVHPTVVNRWKGPKYFFFSGVPQDLIPNVDKLISTFIPNIPGIDTGGNAGSSGISLALGLGCNPICTIGLDFAYPKGTPYSETQYHDAWMQSVGEGKPYPTEVDMIKKVYHPYKHPIFKTECYTDFVYEVFAKSTVDMVKHYTTVYNRTIINATEGGAFNSSHLKCMKFRTFLDRYAKRREA